MFQSNILLCISFILSVSLISVSQKIEGTFHGLNGQLVKLVGYNGIDSYWLDSAIVSKDGSFSLRYPEKYRGVGYLTSDMENPQYFVLLTGETIILEGYSLSDADEIIISKGEDNILFKNYSQHYFKQIQLINAWYYLKSFYTEEKKTNTIQLIENEIKEIKREDSLLLSYVTSSNYLNWYLPIRKLISSVYDIAKYRVPERDETLKKLRSLDYSDNRLLSSGMIKELINNHIWFIENTFSPIDSVFIELNTSIDIIVEQLNPEHQMFDQITSHLMHTLEKHSLILSAEYLAYKLQNEENCVLNEDFLFKIEAYNRMRVGNKAPRILFGDYTYFRDNINISSLYDITSDITAVVFVSSSCSYCIQEIPELINIYETWRAKGVEIVVVSIEKNSLEFAKFLGKCPFTCTTDLEGWYSELAAEYNVYATPTFYVLDNEKRIIYKPKSSKSLSNWIEANIK